MQFTLDVSPEDIKAGEKISQNTAAKARAANNEVEKAAPAPKKKTLPPHVEEYIERGWTPIPLPAGEKFPPKSGMTGNIPPLTKDEIREHWKNVEEGANLGVRVPVGVVGIDVDSPELFEQFKAAHELTELPESPYNTRHGAGAQRRHMFFTVPEGYRARGELKVGPEEVAGETIQPHHRYSVAWPSECEGKTYQWFSHNDAPTETPSVASLNALPEDWLKALAHDRTSSPEKAAVVSTEESVAWLAENCADFGGEVAESLQRTLDLEWPEKGGRHTAMTARQLGMIRDALASGVSGLGAALEELSEQYNAAVEGDRSEAESDREFSDGLNGAVAIVKKEDRPRTGPEDWEKVRAAFSPEKTATGKAEVRKLSEGTKKELDRLRAQSEAREIFDLEQTGAGDWDLEDLLGDVEDLSSVWEDEVEPPTPVFGLMDGGAAIFPDFTRVTLFGPSGEGKSFVCSALAADELKAGRVVLWGDLEQGPDLVRSRLASLGVSSEEAENLRYVNLGMPRKGMTLLQQFQRFGALAAHLGGVLVVLDSFGKALSAMGGDSNSTDDVNRLDDLILRPAQMAGACVVSIDHATKSGEGRAWPIGAQAKRAVMEIGIRCEAGVKKIERGKDGWSNLYVSKDRDGALSSTGEETSDEEGLRYWGKFHLKADNRYSFSPERSAQVRAAAGATRPQTDEEKLQARLPAILAGVHEYAAKIARQKMPEEDWPSIDLNTFEGRKEQFELFPSQKKMKDLILDVVPPGENITGRAAERFASQVLKKSEAFYVWEAPRGRHFIPVASPTSCGVDPWPSGS